MTGPAAAELWQVERALEANDQQRRTLLARRDTLLAFLRSQVDRISAGPAQRPYGPAHAPAPRPYGTTHAAAHAPLPSAHPPRAAYRETSAQSVQNLLLALGGLLLAVAAVVFTVVAWGRFGIAGRATILFTFTAITLAIPIVLVRRRLAATAETIALVGLVLMALDGYAAYRVGAFGLDGVNGYGYSAAVLAVIAATATGYARLVGLRLPTLVAVVLAQPIVPLLAAAVHTTITGSALALALVAGLDIALVAAIRQRPALTPERVIATVCAVIAAGYAIPVSLAVTFIADNPWRAGGVLAVTGGVVIGGALMSGPASLRAFLAGGGILLIGAAAVGVSLPGLGMAGVCAPAVVGLVVALGAIRASRVWRLGGLGAGSVLLAAGAIAVSPSVGQALIGPFTWLVRPWRGAGESARASVDALSGQPASWSGEAPVLPAVLLLAAGAAVVAYAWAGRRGAAAAIAAGMVAATGVAPVALDLTRPVGLIAQGAVAAALCLVAALVHRSLLSWSAGAAGLSVGAVALAGCMAEQPSTIVGLSVAIAVFGLCTVLARTAAVGAAAAGLLVLALTAQAAAVVLAAGYGATVATWAMLGVAAVAAGAANLAATRRPQHAWSITLATLIACAVATSSAVIWVNRPGMLLAATGTVVVAAAMRWPRDGEREALFGVATLPLLGALITVAEPLFQAYLLPYAWLGIGWGSAPAAARAAVAPGIPWAGDALVPAVLAVGSLAVAAAAAAQWGQVVAVRVAVPAAAVTAGVLPLAFDMPWSVALITLGVIAAGLLTTAVLARPGSLLPPAVSGVAAAMFAGTTIAWSLATAPATVLSLTATALATLLAAVTGRTRPVVLASTVVAASAAVLAAVASALAAGQPARLAAFAAIAVAAGLAALAAVLHRDWQQESLCCEGVAAAGALLGIALSATDPLTLSIALAVTGIAVGATALRPDRRSASYVGTALVIIGSWVRLADLGITAPEAYSVPAGVAALVIGWLRWRQRRHLSSWLVFGPGLASALLPSLAALLLDPADTALANTTRPLGLGLAALAVVLVGGWQRLQAPLLIGGAVLAAVTLHELAPWVAQAVAALPRWVPLAIAGLLLLVVGATYEHRRRDLRRVRDALVRMS